MTRADDTLPADSPEGSGAPRTVMAAPDIGSAVPV